MTKLKPFQLAGARQIRAFKGRALLADEMGLGKTIQSLYWILKTPRRRPVVIVVPASVKYTWQSEAAIHFNMRTEVLEGQMKRRQPLPGSVVIINYDILESWLPVLLKAKPQTVIFDEAHYLKTPRARRTRASRRLVKKASSVIGLSGTPLTNRPIELWSILRIIRPDLFPSREEYAWAYCKPRYTPWGWRYDGATNLKQLNRILRSECMIRRLKKDVLLELPAKTRRIVPFRLASYKEYRRADNEFLVWLKETSPSRAMRAKKSLALVKVGYLLRLVAKLKMEWTKQWIEEFFIAHPGEKLVALTMHTFVIDQLKERFPSSVVIDGRVVGRKRDETVRKFQSNRRVNLLLGNWKAAGVGITLHAASNAAALDFPWSPGDLLQGEDRIHRIGQKKKVVIHYLTALGTIEEKLVRILRKKSDILDAVLNGEEDAQSFNIFEDLLEIIRTEKL